MTIWPSVTIVLPSPSLNIIRSNVNGELEPAGPTDVNLRFSKTPSSSIGYRHIQQLSGDPAHRHLSPRKPTTNCSFDIDRFNLRLDDRGIISEIKLIRDNGLIGDSLNIDGHNDLFIKRSTKRRQFYPRLRRSICGKAMLFRRPSI